MPPPSTFFLSSMWQEDRQEDQQYESSSVLRHYNEGSLSMPLLVIPILPPAHYYCLRPKIIQDTPEDATISNPLIKNFAVLSYWRNIVSAASTS